MTNDEDEMLRVIARQLAWECERAGLRATFVDRPTAVRVSSPGAPSGLAETVTLKRDEQNLLMWWWSWGNPICSFIDVGEAVKAITRVVTPPLSAQA